MANKTVPTTTALIAFGGDETGNGGYIERVSVFLAAHVVRAGLATPATAEAREAIESHGGDR